MPGTTEIRLVPEPGVIRVVYRGKVQYEQTTRMLRDVARLASETNTSSLLFDIRDADYRDYHLEAIKHAEEGPSLGIAPATYRIAFLGSADEAMLGFIENVTVNRNYRAKAFTDESQALAWLRSEGI